MIYGKSTHTPVFFNILDYFYCNISIGFPTKEKRQHGHQEKFNKTENTDKGFVSKTLLLKIFQEANIFTNLTHIHLNHLQSVSKII